MGIGSVSAQSKIAHLNSQELLQAMPSYHLAEAKLDSFESLLLKELEEMKGDFNLSITNYQSNLESCKSPALIQIEEEKLIKKEQYIRERQDNIQLELQAYSHELTQPILDNVEKAVKIVSDRNKYDYVFDVSTLMIHNGPDITNEVLSEIEKMEATTAN